MYRAKSTRKPRRLAGRGRIIDWVRRTAPKVNAWLQKTKVLSRLGDLGIGFVPQQYRPLADTALAAAKTARYGRRRSARAMYGRGVGIAGGALRLAGARSY